MSNPLGKSVGNESEVFRQRDSEHRKAAISELNFSCRRLGRF
jgi:hypothetical protein